MNWLHMLWPMAAASSLTLALVHLRRWLGQRDEWANLLFSVSAIATAVLTVMELMIARSETTAQYATNVFAKFNDRLLLVNFDNCTSYRCTFFIFDEEVC